MAISDRIAQVFRKVLPSPFTIAIILTLIVIIIGVIMPNNAPKNVTISNLEFNPAQDSVVVQLTGASSYEWSNGEIGEEIYVAIDEIPNTVIAKNSSDGYEATYHITNSQLLCDPGPCISPVEIDLKQDSQSKFYQLLKSWETGMWNNSLLAFLVQMMLMLVLGHVLALSKPVDNLISKLTQFCTNNGKAVVIVSFITIVVSLFNWGLGLIFGAIFARKVAEHAKKRLIKINYPLIGAAGYSGLMVWHGGISGSAPIKISEDGAMGSLMSGKMTQAQIASLPDSIGFGETIFSSMNLVVAFMLLVLVPLSLYLISRKSKVKVPDIDHDVSHELKLEGPIQGAEKLDHSKIISYGLGALIIIYCGYNAVMAQKDGLNFNFINPNYINLSLLGLCFMLYGSFNSFLNSVQKAIGGTTGILLQFPLYFGILGLMKCSGLMSEISEFFIANSNEVTYPIYTFFSAGIVNIFVPSGGGQWAVQGPIVIEAANSLGVPLNKSIMALAYGDQLTNMLQPFWALPLLSITKLKAKQILPYTLLIMIVGACIFISGLLLF